jgi:cytochrome P450
MTETQSRLGVEFDPWAAENFDDPIKVYDQMREIEPIHWNERRQLWFVSRFADVMTIMKDRHHFVAGPFQAERPHMERSKKEHHREFAGSTMLTTEPPVHTRLRPPANPAFSPKAMKGFEAKVVEITNGLLDKVESAEEWDLIRNLAYPLPVLAISALLGIPEDMWDELLGLVRAEAALLAIDPRAEQDALDDYASMGKAIELYVMKVVAAKRELPPGDDLMSVLLAEEAAGRLSAGELLSTVHLMIEAGHVTTVNHIGNGVNLLLEDRSRFEALVADPHLARSAAEECLRMDGPVHFAGRITSADVEIEGHQFREGDIVILLFTAANRDPAQFPNPTEFVIDRSPNAPTNFGAGMHRCIGANLALTETEVALRCLALRFPNLRLAHPPERQRTFELRGFRELIVTAK